MITLKQLCKELKLDPRDARERIRSAASDPKKYPNLVKSHKPRMPWKWEKGSACEKEVLSLLAN